MARPSRSDNSQPESSVERRALGGTVPLRPSGFDSIHSVEVPAHQAADLEISSTTCRPDSGRWVGRASSSLPLYRREEPAPQEDGTLVQPRIHSTGAPRSREELPANVLASGSGTKSFRLVSFDISRQRCLNKLDFLS